MIGLEAISHWQFIQGLLLCLAGYYIIILCYLSIKGLNKPGKLSFETELSRVERPKVEAIQAKDFHSQRVCLSEQDDTGIYFLPPVGYDPSGYQIEELSQPGKMSNVQLQSNLDDTSSQTIK